MKEASAIEVGDVVFCEVQQSKQYYAHIVLEKTWDYHAEERKYWIGNIQKHKNGWCLREHIFGILVDVQVWRKGQYHSRPLPRKHFMEVAAMVEDYRWSKQAAKLCEPAWES